MIKIFGIDLNHRKYRLLRFLAAGVLNTLFGYGCFATLIYAGLHYTLAAFIGTVLGVIFNFFTMGGLVFKVKAHHRLHRFVGVYGFLYVLNVAWLKWMVFLKIDIYIGGALAIIPLAALSYVLNGRFVFNHD